MLIDLEELEIDLGKVSIKVKDEPYSSEVAYERLDLVKSGRNSYLSKVDNNIGNPLTDESKWYKMVGLEDVDDAVARAIASAASANTAAQQAQAAKTDANASSYRAERAALAADSAVIAAQQASQQAHQATEASLYQQQALNEQMGRMEDLAQNVVNQTLGVPYRMEVSYLPRISTKNVVQQKIRALLYPTYNPQNVLFSIHKGDSVDVDPSGNLTVEKAGRTSIWVIPTMNTALWQEAVIDVVAPSVRKASATRLRLSGTRIRLN